MLKTLKSSRFMLVLAALVLLMLTLTACGKSAFGLAENTGKLMLISAENADKGAFFLVGSLEVDEGEQIVISSELTKGQVRVEIIGAPGEQSIDELPRTDGTPIITAELRGADGAARTVGAGSYYLKATCVEKASGSVRIAVEPAGESGDPAYYSAVTAMDKDSVEEIAAYVRAAYLDEDWASLTKLIRYPVLVNGTPLEDEAAFLGYMNDRTVHESDRAEMERENCRDMFFNGQGICMGAGEVWLLDPNYMTDGDPQLLIIAFTGIVER